MVDIIGEIISYEKQAEEIVQNAEKERERILEEANKTKEEIRLKYLAERDDVVKHYHDDLKVTGKQHIHDTNDIRDEKIGMIDSFFDENGEKLADDIFSAVINI